MSSFRQPGAVFTDHFFEVPLDHAVPDGEQITVFAREMVALEHSGRDNLPWLLYLQGGPGRPSPRPVSRKLGWLDRALRDYRLLLLDQRGTGRSTPASRLTLAARGSAKEQAEYLTHFRADSIVADAELIRQRLTGGRPWSVQVPVSAAIYYNDMYVPQQFSVQTAARIGGLRSWITSEYEHDGLSSSRDRVLDRLIGMVRGTI